ncbi:unnamed protein product [Fraxinus pennsylvanica]|uniref:Disease resistance R13L4/SHOC-2-like LRR domain-containing protein n=1 Tax=Fraxinus pennsylvanica TaxID=56036 RepID=A0AAD1Z521_9LAMI|nr:unnamed protein product [Fraxinus pennsylvanica]
MEISGCFECQEIPMLGHLPRLKDLYLRDLRNVRSISPSFYGESDCSSTSSNDGQGTKVSFRSLKRLTIRDMLNLTEWEEAQTSRMQVFPCLEYLILDRCGKLTHVPHLRGSGASLKEMKISSCDELRELPYDLGSLQSLETLDIRACRNLQSISYQNGQEGLLSLRKLFIVWCNELSNLPNEMLKCSKSLQHLSVWDCQNLTSFPEMSGMGSLQKLIVGGCNNLTSLIELEIGQFSNFNSFQDFFDGIEHIKSLEKLELLGRADWISLPDELQHLTFLKKLRIRDFGMEELPDWFGNLSSLEKLSLFGQEDWVSLRYQFQHLTSLKELEIHTFGMEALPDWFGNLSSLEVLSLSCCEKLRHLPSKEAMQRLTKLKKLHIWGCPLLEEKFKAESGPDSEWPKISHIPYW